MNVNSYPSLKLANEDNAFVWNWTANVFCYRLLNESVPLSAGRDGNYASTKPHMHLLASEFPTVPLLPCPQLHQRGEEILAWGQRFRG